MRLTPAIIIGGGILVFGLQMYDMVSEGRKLLPSPDPNHMHADFAVWVNETKLDFSDSRYMTGESAVDHTHDKAVQGTLRQYLHLHDGNGHVIHKHKPALTLGNFFESIGLPMSSRCLILDPLQFSKLDTGWVHDFAITKSLCNNGKFHWTMYVNGTVVPMNPDYSFADLDKILLTYSAGDDNSAELKDMTDDACRYSLRCPWKGKPPVESCLSDPTVPCTQ